MNKSRDDELDVLFPGDQLFVPIEKCSYDVDTDKFHEFTVRLPKIKEKLRLRVVEGPYEDPHEAAAQARDLDQDPDWQPGKVQERTAVAYLLEIGGQKISGKTDAKGMIECDIPVGATAGTLILEPDTATERSFKLRFGHLNPLSKVSGLKQRLNNLELYPASQEGLDENMNEELEIALIRFQELYGLDQTGEPDAATCAKLKQVHGS